MKKLSLIILTTFLFSHTAFGKSETQIIVNTPEMAEYMNNNYCLYFDSQYLQIGSTAKFEDSIKECKINNEKKAEWFYKEAIKS